MANLTILRDAAVAALKTARPDIPRVEAFAGEITIDSMGDKKLPLGVSILVAAIGAENDAGQLSPGDLDFVGTFGVLIICENRISPEVREADALSMAESAALSLHGNTFGLDGVSPAVVRSMEPIRDDALDKASIAVWTVVWQQAFGLGG